MGVTGGLVRRKLLSGATTLMLDGQNPVHMVFEMVSLHFYNNSDRYCFDTASSCSNFDCPTPRVRHLFDELHDMAPGGFEQSY